MTVIRIKELQVHRLIGSLRRIHNSFVRVFPIIRFVGILRRNSRFTIRGHDGFIHVSLCIQTDAQFAGNHLHRERCGCPTTRTRRSGSGANAGVRHTGKSAFRRREIDRANRCSSAPSSTGIPANREFAESRAVGNQPAANEQACHGLPDREFTNLGSTIFDSAATGSNGGTRNHEFRNLAEFSQANGNRRM